MMRCAIGILALPAIILFCSPPAYSDTKSGEATLQEAKGADIAKKALKFSLGDKVKAECTYYIIPEFAGKKAVSVQARVKNTSTKTMFYGYYVAFFDKDKNLIATSSFGGTFAKLEPGKETTIGNVLELPIEQIKKIASYQVTLLEDEKEFGK